MAEVPKTPMDDEDTAAASSHVNGDGDRQVLAPTEGPREDLINTAIKFLQNPKVMGSPLLQKKAFLSKKGLTQTEINIAVERAGVKEMAVANNDGGNSQARPPPPGYQPGMMVPASDPYGPVQPPIPAQSRLAQIRDLTLSTVVIASFSYAAYHLYKAYIEPLIRGKSLQEKRIDRLESQVEEIHKSVNESLSEISKTLAAIQISVNNQNQQPVASQLVGRGITDLKADISSLRSLLLSKNQFPPPPTNSPMLPSWQLAGASSGGSQQVMDPIPSASTTSTTSSSQSVPSEEATSASAGDTDREGTGSDKSDLSAHSSTDQPAADKEGDRVESMEDVQNS